MAKKIEGYIKLQIPAGNANPAPPVGPALGQHGVNIMDFCKQFNARTADQSGMVIPVVITVYADRSFSFVCKTPPAAVLLKKAAGIESASGEPNKRKVATITLEQALSIIGAQASAGPKIVAQWGGVQVIEGTYGPYIKADGQNYKLPKGTDPYSLKEEEVLELIKNTAPTTKGRRQFRKKS